MHVLVCHGGGKFSLPELEMKRFCSFCTVGKVGEESTGKFTQPKMKQVEVKALQEAGKY